eukprot:g22878.t1
MTRNRILERSLEIIVAPESPMTLSCLVRRYSTSISMSVVGFDFGCDSCVVAVAKRQGIETVQNSVGNRKTASLVSFQGKRRFLGDHAVPYMRTNAKNSIHDRGQVHYSGLSPGSGWDGAHQGGVRG